MTNLWSSNTPARFWLCQPGVPDEQWAAAIQRALPVLGPSLQPDDIDHLLALVLGAHSEPISASELEARYEAARRRA